ncbi:DUF443 family protein [Terribacillus sp. 7520-G]|uniref:DUF443 family protein n=1 Tax=unclassified Terribacillus TaxID=2636508 RepID=UPI000BA6871B|nr:DUF443 family protein [Terribacillus sp. 7520-G]PAD38414.1 hypothetical protein CHH53_10965 [Terribacillus sp. 7520-G]
MRNTDRGEIRRVKGNNRYRILIYNDEFYVIDIGNSIWRNIFPFLFWLLRNPGYKIDRDVALQLTTHQKIDLSNSLKYGAIGSGIATTFSGFLLPLTDLATIKSSLYLNIIITLLLTGILIWTFLFLMNKQKQRLKRNIDFSHLPTLQIRTSRPKFRLIMRTAFVYLFSLAFSVVCLLAFITESNLYILFVGLLLFLMLLLANGAALDHGKYKINIKSISKLK